MSQANQVIHANQVDYMHQANHMTSEISGSGVAVAHCCAIFLCDDHHRNPNNNDRDHLVGQLTSVADEF